MADDPRFDSLDAMDETGTDETEAGSRPPAAPSAGAESEDQEELRRQRDEYYDLLLRKSAEFDNYRKRVERERRELSEHAAASLLGELLPLVDDFERALKADAGDDGARAYRQGVELIHRKLMDLLRRHGVTPIEALGADFDPHLHQAVLHEPSPGHRDGEVIEELQRGYRLRDRLLRPTMVKVAKA